ncbi:MAG: hypothetical protein C5B48_13985 [Candidatus Rokuibacteriota bacterium]|nr:MAG: hypothetical protein C5B48_13985 [Candidatus Rokubacteria bacterium]
MSSQRPSRRRSVKVTSVRSGVNARSTRTADSVPTISSHWRSGASNEHSIAAANPSPKSSQPEHDVSTPDVARATAASTRTGGRPAAAMSGATQ